MKAQRLFLPIVAREKVAVNTYTVQFGLADQKFIFTAGQHIEVRLQKLLYPDNKGNFRLFSIASSPNNKSYMAITFRNTGSGFKHSLLNQKRDELVEISGPFGFFTLPHRQSEPLVFIAGGIGITPFYSMIQYATEEKLKHKITLLYANKNPQTTVYLQELKRLRNKNQNFDYKIHYGKIDKNFIQSHTKTLDKPVFYIAGPSFMVPDIHYLLIKLEVPHNRIITEEFVGY